MFKRFAALVISLGLVATPAVSFGQADPGRSGDPGRNPWVPKGGGALAGPLQFKSFANGSEPSSPREGDVIWSDTDNKLRWYTGAAWETAGSGGGGGSSAFNDITTGTNTTATMTVGTGASIVRTGSGIVDASLLLGATWAEPAAIGSTTPAAGTFTTFIADGMTGDELTITQPAGTTGTVALTVTPGAHTAIGDSSELIAIDMDTDATRTWTTGGSTITNQREVLVRGPTYAADTDARTITNAATFAIAAAPTAGTNVTITNGYALWVQAGAAEFDGAVNASSLTLDTALAETQGGTSQTTYTTGDVLYASGANTLAKLAAGSDGEVLTLASGVPSWAAASAGGTGWEDAGTTVRLETSTDSVAIGVATAATKLHVGSGSPAIRIQDTDSATGIAMTGFVEWRDSGALQTAYVGDASSGDTDFYVATTRGDMVFHANTGGTSTERMRIESGGMVGINITNPSVGQLEVGGRTFLVADTANGNAIDIVDEGTAALSIGTNDLTSNENIDLVFRVLTSTGSQIRHRLNADATVVYTHPALTGLTAATEHIDMDMDFDAAKTFNGGSYATQRTMVVRATTLNYSTATTVDDAATLAITDAPTAGTSATLTGAWALWVQSGESRFDDDVSIDVADDGNLTVLRAGALRAALGDSGGSDTGDLLLYDSSAALQTFLSGGQDSYFTGKLAVGNTAATATLTVIEPVTNTGVPHALLVRGAAHTAMTASTEVVGVDLDVDAAKQWATGALSTQREVLIRQPSYQFVGASTITDAASFAIAGAPTEGTNATITNAYSLWVQDGQTQLDDDLVVGDGTNNDLLVDVSTGFVVAGPSGFQIARSDQGSVTPSSLAVTFTYNTGNQVIMDAHTGAVDVLSSASANALVMGTLGLGGGNNAGWRTDSNRVRFLIGDPQAGTGVGMDVNGFIGIDYSYEPKEGTGDPVEGFLFNGPIHTELIASAEVHGVDFDLDATKTWNTGGITTQREIVARAPTYAFDGASTVDETATFAITGPPIAGANATLTETYALWVESGSANFDGRITGSKGADVASGTNVTLGEDGNYFDITGTTTIDCIVNTRWPAGSVIYLQFDASVTVTDGGTCSGANEPLALLGSINFTATAEDTLTLVYDGAEWRELARTII